MSTCIASRRSSTPRPDRVAWTPIGDGPTLSADEPTMAEAEVTK
jgi:hypothetical protein